MKELQNKLAAHKSSTPSRWKEKAMERRANREWLRYSHEIAMMMSIALRFIPILMEETDKIMKAQMARGADFENGSLIKRAKAMVPILVPLFVSAFRRANELAMAMEARCYHGSEGRTKMKPLKYEKRDRIAYISMVLYLGVIIIVKIIAA